MNRADFGHDAHKFPSAPTPHVALDWKWTSPVNHPYMIGSSHLMYWVWFQCQRTLAAVVSSPLIHLCNCRNKLVQCFFSYNVLQLVLVHHSNHVLQHLQEFQLWLPEDIHEDVNFCRSIIYTHTRGNVKHVKHMFSWYFKSPFSGTVDCVSQNCEEWRCKTWMLLNRPNLDQDVTNSFLSYVYTNLFIVRNKISIGDLPYLAAWFKHTGMEHIITRNAIICKIHITHFMLVPVKSALRH